MLGPVAPGTVTSGQAQGQASDKCNARSVYLIFSGGAQLKYPSPLYASYVCNVVKYASMPPSHHTGVCPLQVCSPPNTSSSVKYKY